MNHIPLHCVHLGLLFLLLSHSFQIPSAFQYARCFQKLERHSIDNSQPLTEIFRSTPLDCLEQCITHTGNGEEQEDPGYCRSVVYDHLQHSCRLYSHDGRKVPSVVLPSNGFDLYRRTSSMKECVGPIHRLLALNAKKGAVYAAPNQENSANGKAPIPAPQSVSVSAEDTLGDDELATLLDQFEQPKGDDKSNTASDHKEEGSKVIAELDCTRNGRTTGYLTYIGGQPIEGAEEFMGWTEPECTQFCTSNLGPEGNAVACAGFSHVPGGSKCYLHAKVTYKVTIQQPPVAYAGIYAEKWCIPPHRFGICRESVHFPVLLRQRFTARCVPLVILGQIHTLTECLAKCMEQRGCQTASFHSASRRCLLYSQLPVPFMIMSAGQEEWTLVQNSCALSRTGPMRTIDSENGQMEFGNQRVTDAAQQQQQQNSLQPTRARQFGQLNKPCGRGEGIGGGGGMGMWTMPNMLFGGKKK